MARSGNKRGLLAPEPAAQIGSLDFAAATQAWRRARDLAEEKDLSDEEGDARSDAAYKAADHLISTPARSPAEIGEKIAAYGWSHAMHIPDLSDPAKRLWIAQHGDELAKGLLTIYLDVTHSKVDPVWEQTLARFEAIRTTVDAYYDDADDDAEPTPEQNAEWRAAKAALLTSRAPDARAMAYKLAWAINHYFTAATGDSATNPATISRMLADDFPEQIVASLYQDALALAGEAGPLVEAQPDPFDPEAWLAEVEAATGARAVVDGNSVRLQWDRSSGGTGLAAAQAAFDSLDFHRETKVSALIFRTRTPPREVYRPREHSLDEARAILLDGYLNTFPQDERDAIRAKLEAVQ